MNPSQNRILAVQIRAGRLGYALLESSNKLLDFGAVWLNSTLNVRVRLLLKKLRPSLLVLRKSSAHSWRPSNVYRKLGRIARNEAHHLGIDVAWVSRREFTKHFRTHSCRNKYEIAAYISQRFPELKWRLPLKRKIQEPEPRAMIYFDSIALGLVYSASVEDNTPDAESAPISPASK